MSDAIQFLEQLESAVVAEMRSQCIALTGTEWQGNAAELSDLADLGHVIAHWHDDADYLDTQGRPRMLPFRGSVGSLSALIDRVYPHKASPPVVRALLRAGVVRKRGRKYECTARHLVFPAGLSAYLSGLTSILGLTNTLRSNISGEGKRLQRTVLNSRIPVAELPALYRSIDQRICPILEVIDVDMLRRERRATVGKPVARVGLAVQLFEFPDDAWPSSLTPAGRPK